MSTIKTNNVQIGQSLTASQNFTWYQPASPDGTVRLGNGNAGSVTDLVTLTSAGNLGIGVTPSTWTLYKSLELGRTGNGISGYISGSSVTINANAYYNSGWKYANSAVASQYEQDSGVHKWYTATSGTAGNAITFNQAMTLDASGNLYVGGTYLDPIGSRVNSFTWRPAGITVRQSGSNQFGLSSTSGTQITWYTDNGTNYVGAGTITSSGSSTAYNTSSDQRLKENIVDAPNALNSVNAIKVRSFDWKGDGSHSEYGYIAQELLEVAPEAVHVPNDPEEMMGVDYGKLTPRLVKAIQELHQEIETLKQRIK